MPDLPPTLRAPAATPLGLLGWRPRTDDDHGLVRALLAALRRTELDLLGGDADRQAAFVDLQLRARDQHRDRAFPGARLGVLTLDDVAVGQLDLHVGDGVLDLLELHVVPGLRGHGLGTTALGALLADADAAGLAVRLHVETASPARRLYARHGFVAAAFDPLHVAMERPAPDGSGEGGAATDAPVAEVATSATEHAPAPALPTYEDLAPDVGGTVGCEGGPELELVSVDARLRPGATGRTPYSAVLAGPLDQPLAQGIHRLDFPGTGPVELFIVPIVPEGGRARYELIVT